jgi:anti-sigma B factor antagonist
MTITTTSVEGESLRLTVDGAMTVYEAGANRTELLDALADGKALEIDLAQVDEIDTAGLQLLVLTRREGLKAGKPVRLLAPSMAVMEATDRYGLGSWFDDTGNAPRNDNETKESP